MAKIFTLDPAVARKIAAGEVIEKPASVLRELLDNAIDSGATEIEVRLLEGGLKELTVIDNGVGMAPDDLEMSILPHATSKIKKAEDLYSLTTLGFRGEALSSIATCSRLQITSKEEKSSGHKISCENGNIFESVPFPATQGTSVYVKDLFYSIPGRKKFMKSPQGESTSCLNIFLDKAAAFPQISFRYFNEGKLKYFLPIQSPLERIQFLYKTRLDTQFLREELGISGGPAKITLINSTPSIYRRDRKQIQIFINNRRIHEFSLIQGVEYGYSEILPGGCFPIAFVFIQIDPAVVDFNIHPAKREVKIQDIQPLRNQLVQSVKKFLGQFYTENRYVSAANRIQQQFNKKREPSSVELLFPNLPPSLENHNNARVQLSFPQSVTPQQEPPHNTSLPLKQEPTSTHNTTPSHNIASPQIAPAPSKVHYIGSFKNLFLVAEKGNSLYIVDQHAAHERILFDEFSRVDTKQNLLFPVQLPADICQNKEIISFTKIETLKTIGIELQYREKGWEIISLPAGISHEAHQISVILPELPDDLFELRKKLFATLSCRKAVKEGDTLSTTLATEIVEKALQMTQPTCPHGRPIYFTLSISELYQLIGRDI